MTTRIEDLNVTQLNTRLKELAVAEADARRQQLHLKSMADKHGLTLAELAHERAMVELQLFKIHNKFGRTNWDD